MPPSYTPKAKDILSLEEKFLPGAGENITPAPLSNEDMIFVKNEIKIKRQQICKLSQFVLSKILNGCYGYIDVDTTDGIISNEYWLFNINTKIILKKYFGKKFF